MSEFASTITENLELLAKKKNVCVKKQKFLAMQETLAPFFGKFESAKHQNRGRTDVVGRKTSPADNVVRRRGDGRGFWWTRPNRRRHCFYLAHITGLSRRCWQTPASMQNELLARQAMSPLLKRTPQSQECSVSWLANAAVKNLARPTRTWRPRVCEDDSDNEGASTSGSQSFRLRIKFGLQFHTLVLPFQTQTRQVKIRKPLKAQKGIARLKDMWWNTLASVWYYIQNKCVY